jgi:hypothetical protein
MGSPGAVHDAYRLFEMNRERWKVTALEKLQETAQDIFFLFSDLNGNWWELTSAQQ